MTDGRGVQTQVTYGDIVGPNGTVSGLYPTQTVAGYGTAVARTSVAVYDFYTGLVTSATDVDNGVTSATEYDALGRPLKSIAALGTPLEIWTQTEYDDINRRVIVRSDLETKGDGKKVAVQHYDQLGRVRLSRSIENIAIEDPYNETHGIKVQTRYHTGNPNSYQLTSNPFRAATASAAGNEPTMGWTRSMSVNTGRHAETETFSGANLPAPWGSNTNSTGKVQSDTDANATTVTDQAGKLRRSITNALGQLTKVDEPNASNQLGSISAPNQPSSVDVVKNVVTKPEDIAFNTQCHGLTFTNGAVAINVDQVDKILTGEGFGALGDSDKKRVGDVAIYRDENGVAVHSATVSDVSEVGKVNSVSGLGGLQTKSHTDPPEQQFTVPTGGKIEYYRRSKDDRTDADRLQDVERIKTYEKKP